MTLWSLLLTLRGLCVGDIYYIAYDIMIWRCRWIIENISLLFSSSFTLSLLYSIIHYIFRVYSIIQYIVLNLYSISIYSIYISLNIYSQCIFIHIYVYISWDRERGRERNINFGSFKDPRQKATVRCHLISTPWATDCSLLI